MQIANNILRHHLRNCYFINGTAYAGKSTMCAMLAERYGMIHCEENYGLDEILQVATPQEQPNVSYPNTMPSWQHFVLRSPEEYQRWVDGNSAELAQFEVAELIRRSASGQKLIVDTNIPLELLWQISDYDHVAIMLCDPPDITKEKFFDRDDPDKKFMMDRIKECPDPKATLANFNAWATYHPPVDIDWQHTGFFSITRSDFVNDTREEVLSRLAEHFKL